MGFCTAITCMDGRVQLPVLRYLQNRFKVEYVDTITEPGPIRILAERKEREIVDSILNRLCISVDFHCSVGVALVGHHDCAGNPVGREVQLEQIHKSVDFVQQAYPTLEVIGLWVDAGWEVQAV